MAELNLLIFLVAFIHSLIYNAVCIDKIQPTTVQEGCSVQLNISKLLDFDDLVWTKDKKFVVVSYNSQSKEVDIRSSFKGKVDFSERTFSLTLKSIQRNESGIYKATASRRTDETIGLYNVSVVDTKSHGSTIRSISLTWIIFLLLLY